MKWRGIQERACEGETGSQTESSIRAATRRDWTEKQSPTLRHWPEEQSIGQVLASGDRGGGWREFRNCSNKAPGKVGGPPLSC